MLVSAFIVTAALFIYIKMVQPQYSESQLLSGELDAKSKIYDDQSSAITQVQNLISQSKSLSKENLSLALPSKENVADILGQLQTISLVSGVSIQSLSLDYLPLISDKSQLSFVKSLGTLRLNLTLFGSYESFKNAIASLETNLRIMDARSLKIQPVVKSPGAFIYDLTVDTYYQAD